MNNSNNMQRVIDTTHDGVLTNRADVHFVVDAVGHGIESVRSSQPQANK